MAVTYSQNGVIVKPSGIPSFLQRVEWWRNTTPSSNWLSIYVPFLCTYDTATYSHGCVISDAVDSNYTKIYQSRTYTNNNGYNQIIMCDYRGDGRLWMHNDGAQVSSENTGFGTLTNTKATLEMKYRTAYAATESGGSWSRQSSYGAQETIWIVGISLFSWFLGAGDNYAFGGKWYEMFIKDGDGKKILDLVPCYHKTTNEPYAFDLISGNFGSVQSQMSAAQYMEYGPVVS